MLTISVSMLVPEVAKAAIFMQAREREEYGMDTKLYIHALS